MKVDNPTNLLQIDGDLGFIVDGSTQHVDDVPPRRTLPPRVLFSVDHGGRRIGRSVEARLGVLPTYGRTGVDIQVAQELLRTQMSARDSCLDGFVEGHVDRFAVGRQYGVQQQC